MPSKKASETYERIYAAVKRIPKGRVATYGQVAALAGLPGQARLVGYALSALGEGHRVPWQRVINARGELSQGGSWGDYQRILLETEGVVFGKDGKIDLARFQWRPRLGG